MFRNKALALAIAALSLSAGVNASAQEFSNSNVTPGPQQVVADELILVSDYELNRFLFQGPLKRVHFPASAAAPLLTPPIYMADNSQVLLQFHKGETKPIQMVAELRDGRVFPLRLAPRPVPGVSHFVSDGAEARNAKGQLGANTPDNQIPGPRAADIRVMKALASYGEPQNGFSPTTLPVTARFDKFTVVPMSAWTDGNKQAFVFSIVAQPGETAVVAPPQFYRPGITAVMIDGDVVDEKNSRTLYVVEELANE